MLLRLILWCFQVLGIQENNSFKQKNSGETHRQVQKWDHKLEPVLHFSEGSSCRPCREPNYKINGAWKTQGRGLFLHKPTRVLVTSWWTLTSHHNLKTLCSIFWWNLTRRRFINIRINHTDYVCHLDFR